MWLRIERDILLAFAFLRLFWLGNAGVTSYSESSHQYTGLANDGVNLYAIGSNVKIFSHGGTDPTEYASPQGYGQGYGCTISGLYLFVAYEGSGTGNSGQVVKIPTSNFLAQLSFFPLVTNLNQPRSVVLTERGSDGYFMYITEKGAGQVIRVGFDGGYNVDEDGKTTVVSELGSPVGLAVSSDGSSDTLYVGTEISRENSGGSIYKVTGARGSASTLRLVPSGLDNIRGFLLSGTIPILYAVGGTGEDAYVYHINVVSESKQKVSNINFGGSPYALGLHPSSKEIVVSSDNGKLYTTGIAEAADDLLIQCEAEQFESRAPTPS